MLLLFPQGTSGTIAVGASDTANLQATEDPTSDFFIATLDDILISLGEAVVPAVRVDRSDFPLIALGESAGVSVSGTTAIAGTETASLTLTETSAVAVTVDVTDTASLTLTDAGVVDIGQVAKDVTDTASLIADDSAFSSVTADVSRVAGDDINLSVEDRGEIFEFLPVALIRFEARPDHIRFTTP